MKAKYIIIGIIALVLIGTVVAVSITPRAFLKKTSEKGTVAWSYVHATEISK